jgi:hypothetical protein
MQSKECEAKNVKRRKQSEEKKRSEAREAKQRKRSEDSEAKKAKQRKRKQHYMPQVHSFANRLLTYRGKA